MLSRSMTTSCFCSTSLLALSIVISDTLLCLSGSSSKVEYMTSTLSPSSDSLISVTSSGLSSIRRIIRCISLWFFKIELAICFNNVVLPALGCATIIPLWPFPIGLIRSTTLIDTLLSGSSRCILSLGNIGVSFSNAFLLATSATEKPFTDLINKRALNFSP